MEQLVHEVVLSTLYLLFKHLLISCRSNIHDDSSMDQGEQLNAHFLTVWLNDGLGNALVSMLVNI